MMVASRGAMMTVMPQTLVGSGTDYLMLTPDDSEGGPPQFLLAELRLDGLSASVRVVQNYATGFRDLADFFQQQADDWKGCVCGNRRRS
jgi:hypothetical protein